MSATYIPVPAPLRLTVLTVVTSNALSLFLQGAAFVQFFLAFDLLFQPQEDARARKTTKWRLICSALCVLFGVACADTVMKFVDMIQTVEHALAEGPVGVLTIPSVAPGVTSVEAFTAIVVQMTYIIRLGAVIRRGGPLLYIGLAFCALLSLAQAGGAIWVGVIAASRPITTWGDDVKNGCFIWFGVASANDVLLCLAFIIQLHSIRTGWKQTDQAISRAITFTLETGLLSTLAQIVCLILLVKLPDKPFFFASPFILTQIYMNSVLTLYRRMLSNSAAHATTSHASSSQRSGERRMASQARSNNGKWNQRPIASDVMVSSTMETKNSEVELSRVGAPGRVNKIDLEGSYAPNGQYSPHKNEHDAW